MFSEFNWFEAIKSSPIFIVLVLCSIATLGIVIERAVYFFRRKGDGGASIAIVLEKISAGNITKALGISRESVHPAGIVAQHILELDSHMPESVEERIHVGLSQEKMLFEHNLSFLGTMAAISPLIGLLGTIWGIMRAFQDMAMSGSSAPAVVAAGIAEALLTTAAGIIIAVPAILFYNHFVNRMNVMLSVAENYARSIRSIMIEKGLTARAGLSRELLADDDESEGIQENYTETAGIVGVR